ncbi:AAA family ATPase [Paenibacillus sp. GCM10012307]|uniref:Nuclease SbcCD subunit C n=1 Tax=Paenibacillus roseus TaxID=2798579 RepID=A0A934J3A1_9BACL|nr:AAA family ATPase [Paenibacillus roseus]MBJ6360829.1 hypothetical protein [Paenibacillus roseus]
MNTITLQRLTLRNFKGFREFQLVANGQPINVFGDNGTGKTTLFDAFTWLLFGKDSANRTDFEIKELDSAGKVRQHKLEHEVEGVLGINGKNKMFRRVFVEKWTKKRGSLTAAFEGHETSYFVDGVPVAKKEYDAAVTALLPEELFKLLTSPTFFNEQLKWQDRRKLLLEVCGDVTDAEVIHSRTELAPLEAILRDRNIDDHKKVVAASMKRINQEIDDIPVRISEAQRSMPNVSEISEDMLKEDIVTLRERLTGKEQELVRVQSGGQAAELQHRLREIEGEQLQIKNVLQTAALDSVAQQRAHVDALHRDLDKVRRSIDDRQYKIQSNEQRITGLDQERAQLRAEFSAASTDGFAHSADDNCPACGQLLPDERRQEAHDVALADFNRRKAERLESIQRRGRSARDESERLADEITRMREEFRQLAEQQEQLQARIDMANAELDRLRQGVQNPDDDLKYRNLGDEAALLRQQITLLQTDSAQEQQRVQQEIQSLRAEISVLDADLAKFEHVRRQQARITELEQQENKLAGEYEQLQHELFLTEEFTRAKVNLLQSRIDSKFKYARFRLFDEQINGGLREVCDTLYNGVPYDKGLNNAARYHVGIDIINTLSQHYEVWAPIWHDNAEAVTSPAETDAQVIRLIVSEQDKRLRVQSSKDSDDGLLIVDNEVVS